MKAIVFALVALVASINGFPQTKNAAVAPKSERLVAEIVVTLIEEFRQLIRDRNLDPYYLDFAEAIYTVHIEGILTATAYAQSVGLVGLSDIRTNSVNFNLFTGALDIDLVLPRVAGSLGRAAAKLDIVGNVFAGEASGSLVVNEVRVVTSATVGISSGIDVNDIKIDFSVGSIDPDLSVNLLGYDLSEDFNRFFGTLLPAGLEKYSDEVNRILEYYAALLIDRYLGVNDP